MTFFLAEEPTVSVSLAGAVVGALCVAIVTLFCCCPVSPAVNGIFTM